jgi:TonB family protein
MQTRQRASFLMISAILLATAVMIPSAVRAQGGSSDWQTLRPEGEEFAILMPKDPKFEEGDEPYHRMTLSARLYLSAADHGPVVAIASFKGIKANGQGYTEDQRLNSYVDAFKNWFPHKVRGKEAIGKLTLVGPTTLAGNLGREYQLVIGDLSGTVRVFATRKRFYAAVILNTKKDDALTQQFLSSFVLPDKVEQQQEVAAATAANTSAPAEAALTRKPAGKEGTDETQKAEGTDDPNREVKTGDASSGAEKKPGERAPISGGVLNGKALSLPQPEYPAIAAQAHAGGTVTVQVLIDESGNVISAHAISGHPLLQSVSVAAARQARFSPTSLMGDPVKVSGVIMYNFVAK